MGSVEWDTSEVNRLAVDLSRAPNRIQRAAPKVLEVAANKIKKSLRQDASGHGYLHHLPFTVNYTKFGPLDYEIGFDDVGQGELANIAVYGSINNAPVAKSPYEHALMESEHMERHFADEAEDAVLGGDHDR